MRCLSKLDLGRHCLHYRLAPSILEADGRGRAGAGLEGRGNSHLPHNTKATRHMFLLLVFTWDAPVAHSGSNQGFHCKKYKRLLYLCHLLPNHNIKRE